MSSLSKHIDGRTIAADVRLQRQYHKGSFLLVEGRTDVRRFSQIIDPAACLVIAADGKPNVVDAVERLYDVGFEGVLGAVDSDFDRIIGVPVSHEGIIVSTRHDFDLDMIFTDALRRYLDEVCDFSQLAKFGGVVGFRSNLISALLPVSAMRFANVRHQLRYDLSSLQFHDFFDGDGVDIERLVDHCSQGRFSDRESKDRLRSAIQAALRLKTEPNQLTSGHDFCHALGIALRNTIGRRHLHQTTGREVEMHMRLAVSPQDLAEGDFLKLIREWELSNPPYKILALSGQSSPP